MGHGITFDNTLRTKSDTGKGEGQDRFLQYRYQDMLFILLKPAEQL